MWQFWPEQLGQKRSKGHQNAGSSPGVPGSPSHRHDATGSTGKLLDTFSKPPGRKTARYPAVFLLVS